MKITNALFIVQILYKWPIIIILSTIHSTEHSQGDEIKFNINFTGMTFIIICIQQSVRAMYRCVRVSARACRFVLLFPYVYILYYMIRITNLNCMGKAVYSNNSGLYRSYLHMYSANVYKCVRRNLTVGFSFRPCIIINPAVRSYFFIY